MPYGQIVSGPPGSGKTTYTRGLHEFLTLLKRRPHIVNFDPGADPSTFGGSSSGVGDGPSSPPPPPPPPPSFDVRALVDINSVMSKGLGPNGALQWSFDYLERNAGAALGRMKAAVVEAERRRMEEEKEEVSTATTPTDEEVWSSCYLIVDFPGQVELYTHATSASSLLELLSKPADKGGYGASLVNVNLVDATSIYDAGRFISSCITSLMSTIRLELPTVNVLTKVDLLGKESAYDIEFFAECANLGRLVQYLEQGSYGEDGGPAGSFDYADDPEYAKARANVKNSEFHRRHSGLMSSIVEVLEDFSLVNFRLLSVNDAALMGRLLAECDKCNGAVYKYSEEMEGVENVMFKAAVRGEGVGGRRREIDDVRERYIKPGGMEAHEGE